MTATAELTTTRPRRRFGLGLLSNPVLTRELRTRMRGRRAATIITMWLAMNAGVLALVYLAAQNVAQQRFGFAGLANTVDIGRGIFEWTLFGMLLLMLLIVPAQAAGAIAGERERQTLIPLQVTLLTPRRIVIGKLAASVAFLTLLIVSALPLLAVGYLVGGVGIGDVVIGTGAVLLSGFLVAAGCIAVSTYVRRVQGATVLCYALVLALTVGSLLAYGAYAIVDQSRGFDAADPPDALLLPNPVAFVSDVVGDYHHGEMPSPFDGLYSLVNEEEQFVAVAPDAGNVAFGGEFIGGEAQFVQPERRAEGGFPFWLGSLITLGLWSFAALALAVRRLRTPAETER